MDFYLRMSFEILFLFHLNFTKTFIWQSIFSDIYSTYNYHHAEWHQWVSYCLSYTIDDQSRLYLLHFFVDDFRSSWAVGLMGWNGYLVYDHWVTLYDYFESNCLQETWNDLELVNHILEILWNHNHLHLEEKCANVIIEHSYWRHNISFITLI